MEIFAGKAQATTPRCWPRYEAPERNTRWGFYSVTIREKSSYGVYRLCEPSEWTLPSFGQAGYFVSLGQGQLGILLH